MVAGSLYLMLFAGALLFVAFCGAAAGGLYWKAKRRMKREAALAEGAPALADDGGHAEV